MSSNAQKWTTPPIIKIYEALGAIGDKRIEVDGNTAKVYSSSRGKYYDVTYDPDKNAIMANDNGSYWKGYLGYPSIALLLMLGMVPYETWCAGALKDIAWKDINQKYKNDFERTLADIFQTLAERGVDVASLQKEAARILSDITKLDLSLLGKKTKPPEGY